MESRLINQSNAFWRYCKFELGISGIKGCNIDITLVWIVVGWFDGDGVVGVKVGSSVGWLDGFEVGDKDGMDVGFNVGCVDGWMVIVGSSVVDIVIISLLSLLDFGFRNNIRNNVIAAITNNNKPKKQKHPNQTINTKTQKER